jgi:hypothetical protein
MLPISLLVPTMLWSIAQTVYWVPLLLWIRTLVSVHEAFCLAPLLYLHLRRYLDMLTMVSSLAFHKPSRNLGCQVKDTVLVTWTDQT